MKKIELKTIEDVNEYIKNIMQPFLSLLQKAMNPEGIVYLIPVLRNDIIRQKEEFATVFDSLNCRITISVNLAICDKTGNTYSKISNMHVFNARFLSEESISIFINEFKSNILQLIIHQDDLFYAEDKSQNVGNISLKSAYKIAKILQTNGKTDLNSR